MLIVCPHCSSKYDIETHLIGAKGRQVRCSQCHNRFFVASDGIISVPQERTLPETSSQNDLSQQGLKDTDNLNAIQSREIEKNVLTDISEEVSERLKWPLPDRTSTTIGDDPAGAHLSFSALASHPEKAKNKQRSRAVSFLKRILYGLAAPFRVLPQTLNALVLITLFATCVFFFREAIVRSLPQMAGLYEYVGIRVNLRGLDIEGVRTTLTVDQSARVMVVEGIIKNLTPRTISVPLLHLSVRDESDQALYSWNVEPPQPKIKPQDTMPFRARLASPPIEGTSVLVRFTSRDLGSAPMSSKVPSDNMRNQMSDTLNEAPSVAEIIDPNLSSETKKP